MARLVSPTREFYELLDELKSKGDRFTPETLKLLPYDQLVLASMGNAGACRCPLADVINEKQERRAVLLGLPKGKLENLKLEEEIWGDVQDDLVTIQRSVPSWNDLSVVAKLYFKLVCLENHPHDAFQRLSEVVNLCRETNNALPQQLAFSLKLEFQSALLSTSSDDWVRDSATKASNILYGFISGSEVEIIDKLELRDYVCSAGCFYPLSRD